MSTILLSNFTGILPRMSDSLLPDNAGQVARNVKLQSGEIRPWRKPVKVQPVLQKGVKSIFKMEGTGGETLWCEWVNDTDVCYGPVAAKRNSASTTPKVVYARRRTGSSLPRVMVSLHATGTILVLRP